MCVTGCLEDLVPALQGVEVVGGVDAQRADRRAVRVEPQLQTPPALQHANTLRVPRTWLQPDIHTDGKSDSASVSCRTDRSVGMRNDSLSALITKFRQKVETGVLFQCKKAIEKPVLCFCCVQLNPSVQKVGPASES